MPAPLAVTLLAAALPLATAAPAVREAPIRAHLAFLADDLLEGRGTGQRGGELAVAYLEAQLRALGVAPAAAGGYRQRVDVLGVRLLERESRLTFSHPGGETTPAYLEEIVYGAGNGLADNPVDAPVLFVGYGIAAAEERWDDFKGEDCRGKLLLVLVNDPPPSADEPGRFGGDSLTYYGRWTYKYEEAARRGAAGVLLVHTDASASYGWSVARTGYQGEKFQLADGPRQTALQGWLRESAARTLLAHAGHDLDELSRRAGSREFRPVELDLHAVGRVVSAVRTFPQSNVAGVVEGSDPELGRELVVYSAHWDHFGVENGVVYNGAVDNASACATLLAIAEAVVRRPARRSQMFLFTFGEEQGLIGAKAYVQRPLWPLERTVAALNLESLNWVGPSRDIELLGGERSDLGELGARVAAALGMALRPAEPDSAGLYFRSDHFPFAAAGVPALSPGFSLLGQRDYLGDGERLRAQARGFRERYHQPSDDYDASWDLRGMVQQGQFILELGLLIADAPGRPRWR